MPPPTKQANTDNTVTPGRRSTRLAIAIPIALSGKSSSGAAFKENTRTITINRQGAKVLTMQALTLGTEVVIENRHLGTTARANVVWLGERKGPKDSVEIGVQLSEAANIWGIEFPPEDWQESLPAPAGPGESAPADKPPPPAPTKTPVEVSAQKPATKVADRVAVTAPAAAKATLPATPAALAAALPARPGVPSTVSPEQIQAAIAAAIEQFNAQAEKSLEGYAKTFEDRLARSGVERGFQSQAQLQHAANALEEKMVASLERKFGELGERLATSKNKFEALMARYRELQEGGVRETERTKQNLEAAGRFALQSAVEKVGEEVAREHREIQQEFIAETRAALKDELKSSWKTLAEEAKKQLGTMTHTTVEAMNKEGRAGIEEFRGHLKKSAQENIEKATHELEAELRKAADRERQEHLIQFGKESAAAVDKALAEIRDGADRAVREAREAAREACSESEAARDASTAASTELRAKSEQAIKEASDAVNKHIGSGAVFLKELEEQARTRLEALSEKMDSLVRASESELERKAAEFSTAAMQGMRASSDVLVENFQEQVGSSVQEVSSKFADGLHRKMEGVTEKLVEESKALLSKQSREGSELAAAELEKLKDRLVNETEEAIRARLAEAFSSVFMPGGKRVTDRAAEEAQKKH
jgi:hypothetical protein